MNYHTNPIRFPDLPRTPRRPLHHDQVPHLPHKLTLGDPQGATAGHHTLRSRKSIRKRRTNKPPVTFLGRLFNVSERSSRVALGHAHAGRLSANMPGLTSRYSCRNPRTATI